MKVSQKWRVAAAVMLGPTLAIMDSTIVSVILSELQTAFHTDFQTISWVVSAYFLAQAAVLPIIGYVSDRVGSKVAFLTSLAVFTAGSLLCSLSPTAEALIAFRILQGIGGGALLPLSIAITFRIFSPNERSKASAIFGIPIVLAPTFGPTIGGYLSTSFNWNAVFLINVPFGILDLLLIFLIMPRDTPNQDKQAKEAKQSFDILGLVLSLVGVTILVFGISAAGATGWGDPIVLTSLLVGIAILIAFVVVELRVSDPVLDLRLFLNYTFTIANVLVWLIIGVFTGGLFLIPFFLENARGDTALTVGVFLIGQGLASAVSTTVAGSLYNRVGPRILVVCGLLLMAAGTYGLTQINVNTTGQDLQVWLILRGLGIGLIFQPLNTLALSVVSNKGMAKASSLVNVTRQVTTAAAVATLTTYLTVQTATYGVGPQAIAAGMTDTFWVILILSFVCIAPALVMGRDPAIEAIKKAQQAKVSKIAAIGQVQEGRDERPAEQLLSPQPLYVPTVQGLSPIGANLVERDPERCVVDGFTPSRPLRSPLATTPLRALKFAPMGLSPHAEYIKPLLQLPALSLSELDAVRHHTTMRKTLKHYLTKQQKDHLEQNQHMIWQKTLDRYADEIAALQAELESTRVDIDQRMDAYSAHLQKLSHAIGNDLRASAPPLEMIPLSRPQIVRENGCFITK